MGIAAGCVVALGGIACIMYNIMEEWDWLGPPTGIILLVGMAICAAGCVLFALTLQVMVQAVGGGGTCMANYCFAGFCKLDWFTGVCVCLLGITFFISLGTAISTFMTH